MAKKTKNNTALKVTRSGTTFTCTWKKVASNIKKQSLRYRFHDGSKWGDWTKKSVTASATSTTFTRAATSATTKVQVQCRAKAEGKKWSSYSGCSVVYEVNVPNNPTLTVTNDSATRTTFSWSATNDDNAREWFRIYQYRTKCTATPDSDSGWTAWTSTSATSLSPYTDTTAGTTRILQLRSIGPAGESAIQTERHYLGLAPVATWVGDRPVSYNEKSSYYEMTYNTSIVGSHYTVDSIVPQYYIGSPAADMSCPSGANFTDGPTSNYSDGNANYTLAITTGDVVGENECLWARVKTTHDGNDSFSAAHRVITGKLTAPVATISSTTPTTAGFSVSVTLADASGVPGVYAEVYLVRKSTPNVQELIGSLAHGVTSKTITSTINLTKETGYEIRVRNVTADGHSMASDYDSWTTSMPTAPTLVGVKPTTVAGKVYLTWTNTWDASTGSEIAWTDDPDNWMSNEEPEAYEIEEAASNWYITGLETGKKWYFRVRSTQTTDEATVKTTWSNELSIDLSSAPATPALYLSEEAITESGMVTAYWSFMSTDGTAQIAAELVEAAYSNGAWTYGRTIGSTTSAQHIDIYAKQQGWTNGSTKYIALHTRAGSGGMSDYSTPVKLAIAAKPTVGISSTSLSSDKLTALPLSVTVATTSAKKLSLAIERAHDYPFDRPDGTHTDGAKGETVYLKTISPSANNSFSITLASLMGRLDDGADYNLVASVKDAFGQTAETSIKFTVEWSHQAWAPTATFVTDTTDYTASITPVAGSSYVSGDTCDIYRISVDGPELIYRGAEFGTTYVDPYPAFGGESGYKVLTVTQYGDYIDASNTIAAYDTTEVEPSPYIQLDPGTLVIDFDGARVELPYNITLSNSWKKDFQRTAYLGGSVAGDHNRAILRDATIGTVVARNLDPATIVLMRALASYAGTCHVRTPEGSSFAADIQVSEEMAYDSATADYSLTIQKVDPEGYDGMTLAEWEEENS